MEKNVLADDHYRIVGNGSFAASLHALQTFSSPCAWGWIYEVLSFAVEPLCRDQPRARSLFDDYSAEYNPVSSSYPVELPHVAGAGEFCVTFIGCRSANGSARFCRIAPIDGSRTN